MMGETIRKDYSNQTVIFNGNHPQIPKGSKLFIKGYWNDVTGMSWRDCGGRPGCIIYANRVVSSNDVIPKDDDVLYTHDERTGLSHLVHVSEIEVDKK